jgi:hypothetical protein
MSIDFIGDFLDLGKVRADSTKYNKYGLKRRRSSSTLERQYEHER